MTGFTPSIVKPVVHAVQYVSYRSCKSSASSPVQNAHANKGSKGMRFTAEHPTRLLIRSIGFALAFLVATACGSTPAAPDTDNVSGTWGGYMCAPTRAVSCAIQLR